MAKKAMTAVERVYVGRVKALPCSCCNAPGPFIAHHVRTGQGRSQRAQHWLVVALCESCHVNPFLGIHGERRMMKIMNMDEMDLLAKTIERLSAN